MKAGDVEAKIIPKDSKEGTLTLQSKTGQPLTIKLPQAFAAVPVLAQLGGGLNGGGGGLGGGNGGGGGSGGGNQGIGGGGMMGGMGGGMGGMGGGMFNVPAERAVKLKVGIVCLDHGLKDPNARIPYELVPIESYAKNPAVAELIAMMCQGQIDQHSAQAAAWHIQNGLSWEELARKIGAKHIGGATEPYFTPVQLQRALAACQMAEQRAEQAAEAKKKSPPGPSGESENVSQR
jgi:hypothetical protein